MNKYGNEIIFRKTKYFEYYALLTIRYIFFNNININKGIINDKPDIRIEFNNKKYGIEVTRLIEKDQAEKNFVINKYFGKGLKPKQIKESIEKENKNINVIADKDVVFVDYSYDINTIKDKLLERINSKINKFSSYETMDINCLYVFVSDYGFDLNTIKDILSKIDNSVFDFIFINNYDEIYIFSDNSFETKLIDEKLLKTIKEKSIIYTNHNLLNKNR